MTKKERIPGIEKGLSPSTSGIPQVEENTGQQRNSLAAGIRGLGISLGLPEIAVPKEPEPRTSPQLKQTYIYIYIYNIYVMLRLGD